MWHLLQLGRNHKPIFTIQDEPPTWPSDTDEFMGLESISEPDDMDMDDEDDEAQDDGADEPFFDTRDGTRSPSTSPDASVRGGARSSDFDTEEDPMGPDTPGQTPVGKGGLPEAFNGKRRDKDVDVGDDDRADDDDDDDDWVDPSVSTPLSTKIQAPAMVQTHSNSSSSSSSSGVKVRSKSKKNVKRKSASVVHVLRTPEPSAHFPFPSSVEDTTTTPQQEDFQQQRDQLPEMQENVKKLQRMHTARARDGGRTQSGGVKGVLTAEDSGENF